MTKDKLIVTAGDYDLLSIKDLRFLEKCKRKGDWLIVGLHSDMMVHAKNQVIFNTFYARQELLLGLRCVDEVLRFNDTDGTYCNLLVIVKSIYPLSDITFITKQDMHNMPETKIRGITFETMN